MGLFLRLLAKVCVVIPALLPDIVINLSASIFAREYANLNDWSSIFLAKYVPSVKGSSVRVVVDEFGGFVGLIVLVVVMSFFTKK